jgi:hypothetical protein
MKHKFCGWVGALIVACGLVQPDRADALGGVMGTAIANLGRCSVHVQTYTLPAESAGVAIYSTSGSFWNPVTTVSYVGGTYFDGSAVVSGKTQVTVATVADCLQVTPDLVTDFSSDGANGTFATDDYMGFSFTYAANRYEFAFSGVTNTVIVNSKTSLGPPTDADATLASGPDSEAGSIGSTVIASGDAVSLLDFTLSDGGGGDAAPLSVTDIGVNVSGTAAASASKLTWLLNGPDATNVQGSVSGGKVTFSGLTVSVADGDDETYTISAYFNDNTGLIEDGTLVLSIDGDTDITLASGSTTFGTTSPVMSGSGAAIDVVATQFAFTTEPSGSVSGSALTTQPVVTAQDDAGNTDIDFTGTVTLTEASAGSVSGTASLSAVAGVASFTDLTYSATADTEAFVLTASGGSLTSATSNSVTSDVLATKLVFVTEPAPLSFKGKEAVTFTTAPVVQAQDAAGLLDVDYAQSASLSEVGGAGSATFSGETTTFAAGVATFTGLGLTYTNSGSTSETFNLQASSGSLTTAQSAQLTARLAPAVVSVSSTTGNGSYNAGDTISIQVTFSEAVDVTGTPELLLETGSTDRSVAYFTGTGSTALTFSYTVQAGDTAADLDYAATNALSLQGGTIKSVSDATDAILTLPTPGQSGSLGQSKALVIDTTAPASYTVAFDQDPINDSDDAAASFTFVGAEAGTSYSYTITSSGGGTPVSNTGTIATATDQITPIDVSGLTDGTLTLSVTLTDAAGNAGSAATDTVAKDATLPAGHSVAFVQSVVNNANTSAIGFSFANAEVGTSYSYTISSSGGGAPVTDTGPIATATDQIIGIDVSGLLDGTLTLAVTLLDGASNAATPVTATVTKDVNAPASPSAPTLASASNSGSTTDTLTNAATPTITGTAEANATVEIFVAATSAGTVSADGSGNWSFTFTAGALASGDNTVTATATDAAGNVSTASSALIITIDAAAPTVVITGPTDVVTAAFTATFTFSEAVSDFIADDITVTNGQKGSFAGSGTTYTLVITPVLGTTVSVSVAATLATDPAGNGNIASNTLQIMAGSPASEFAKNEAEIQQVILEEATRSLQSTIAANQRMIREARERFIAGQSREGDGGEEGDVPFDVNGSLDANGVSVSSKGTFYGAQGLGNGTRRLMFGDFDVQQDSETGSSTATVTGRIAWERSVSDTTLLGYFIGGELAQSNIAGSFDGDQNHIGVTAGGYAVHEIAQQVYLDGYVSLGAGQNNLTMTNGVLALDSEYTTRSASLGAALSGVIEQKDFEIWPELSVSYGRTWIGDVGFTGEAYGLTDNTLSLDAGTVTLATILFRPEIRMAMDGLSGAESLQTFSFAPRLICEHLVTTVTDEICGGGAEIGFSGTSADGLSHVSAKVLADRLGDRTNSSLVLNLEHRF